MAPFNRTGFNHIKARLALPPSCVCVLLLLLLLLVSVSSPPLRRVPPQRRAAGRHGGCSSVARKDGAGLFVLRQPPFFPLSRLAAPSGHGARAAGLGHVHQRRRAAATLARLRRGRQLRRAQGGDAGAARRHGAAHRRVPARLRRRSGACPRRIPPCARRATGDCDDEKEDFLLIESDSLNCSLINAHRSDDA